jgi:23S rRNA pseudouridine2605 synthase
MEQESMRLQKYLARCGVASRRAAEVMIREGRVTVDGLAVTDMGRQVTGTERIAVDGQPVVPEERKVYVVLHKPEGYVCTVRDPQGRPTVMALVADLKERVYPVGRLDWDSSGLLLLTNDGDFAYRLTHPRHEIAKCYLALVEGVPSGHELNTLRRGVMLDGRLTAPAEVWCTPLNPQISEMEIVIHEGRNRQVRRMCEAVGHPVRALKRIAIGGLVLGDLPEGTWRHASEADIQLIFA